MYARVSRHAYTPLPCHFMSCRAVPSRSPRCEHNLASRDGLLAQDRTRDCATSLVLRSHPRRSPVTCFLSTTSHNHAERRRSRQGSGRPGSWKGIPWSSWWSWSWRWPRSRWWFCTSRTGRVCHIHFPLTLTHALSASLQRDSLLILMLGLLTRPRTG
jgi:hypothetical protein